MGRNRHVRLAIPLAVIGTLAWLMVGCVYVPWFESVHLTGTRRDFRPLAGNLAQGRASQAMVRQFLGEPVFRSSNDRVWVYTFDTSHGVWIEPLCFHVTPGGRYAYTLALRFDRTGAIERQRIYETDVLPSIGLRGTYDIDVGWPYANLEQIDDDNAVTLFHPDRDHPGGTVPGVNEEFGVGQFRVSKHASPTTFQARPPGE